MPYLVSQKHEDSKGYGDEMCGIQTNMVSSVKRELNDFCTSASLVVTFSNIWGVIPLYLVFVKNVSIQLSFEVTLKV